MGRGLNWTDEEVATLREWWRRIRIGEVAERVGRPYHSVRRKAARLGLPGYDWTPEEDARLREMFGSHTAQEIADAMELRTRQAVEQRLRALGLTWRERLACVEAERERATGLVERLALELDHCVDDLDREGVRIHPKTRKALEDARAWLERE
ncbi:MAG: hypothetical protein HRT64_13585 [Erythrobacter sp.]|nr:hypothetical protein [Erythrobacter sp.]